MPSTTNYKYARKLELRFYEMSQQNAQLLYLLLLCLLFKSIITVTICEVKQAFIPSILTFPNELS